MREDHVDSLAAYLITSSGHSIVETNTVRGLYEIILILYDFTASRKLKKGRTFRTLRSGLPQRAIHKNANFRDNRSNIRVRKHSE